MKEVNCKIQSSSPTLSLPLCIHSVSSHPTPNYPLIFCPFASPIGLGFHDLFSFFCRLVGLNSFDPLSLCRPRRSRHIPSLAQWVLMSGYTLYVFRRAVVTGIGGKRRHIVNASLFDAEDPVPKFLPSN
ncbi:hypothetical protein TNCV_3874261 [Trichonephila clavipes]|nr:hypothetical protein TNCV_3874261 [Trichonephila clavipes]